MIATENTVPPQETLALQQLGQLRGFCLRVVVHSVMWQRARRPFLPVCGQSLGYLGAPDR